jgi:hypothetical protein
MPEELIPFFSELYNKHLERNSRFSLYYSSDSIKKAEEMRTLEFLEDSGYIILSGKTTGFCHIEFTQYGIDYAESLNL